MINHNSTEPSDLDKVQEELRASELRYRRLFETAKDGILILNAETGNIIDVNPFLLTLLGYSFDQLVDKKIWEIGFLKDILENRDNFLELQKNKYIRYEDLPLETEGGKRIDVEFVSNVYQENNHKVIQCNIRDITDRKRIADMIEEERERLSITLRSIGDGVIATDPLGTIMIMNVIAEDLCGWTHEEAFGKPLSSVFNIINENTREPHENPVEKVLSTGKIIELENHTVIISKNGEERIIADSAAPIKNKAGEITGVVLVFRDITEKQQLMEIAQRNQKLESLGLLAGGIAHDFNNLMGGIFGFIDLALLETADNKVTNFLSKALNTIDRARGLTRQLLTFAKGGAPVQKPTSLSPLVQETVEFALSGSNVKYTIDIPRDVCICNIDENQISQVISNIVINAQQAMPKGGNIEIIIANRSLSKNTPPFILQGRYVQISIKDYGIGISKKMLPNIFDPFFTTKNKGHGLGLATCYSIISRHNGIIDVESVLDEGSIFHIYLPVADEEIKISGEKSNPEHKGSGTIIVMDDEEIMRETIVGILETFGYSTISAVDGAEALELFKKEKSAKRTITAIILDLTVPGGLGGKDVISGFRELNAEIPVFVSSGYADDPIMINPEEYGFTSSICKPFRKEELMKLIEQKT